MQYTESFMDENFKQTDNKAVDLINVKPLYFYIPVNEGIGNLKYVVDHSGHALYLIKKSQLPDEIKNVLKGGDAGDGSFANYASLIDVYGITSDLTVYYSLKGDDKFYSTNSSFVLDMESERDIFYKESTGSEYYEILEQYDKNGDGIITSEEIKSVKSLTFNSSCGINTLENLINFPTLKELTLDNVNLSSLKGIEYAYGLTSLTISNYTTSNIDNFSNLLLLKNLNKLLISNSSDEQVANIFNIMKEANFSQLESVGVYDSKTNVTNSSVDILKEWPINILSNIKYAYFYNNNLENIEFLYDCNNISTLQVNNNKLRTLQPCENMKNLSTLHAQNNMLEDDVENNLYALDALSNKTKLTYINLAANTNLQYLKGLVNCPLSKFYLSGCTNLLEEEVSLIAEKWISVYRLLSSLNTKYYNFLRSDVGKVYLNDIAKYGNNTNGSITDLYNLAISNDTTKKEKVKSIWIAGHSELSNEELQTILSAFPNVVSIYVDGCTNLSSIEFARNLSNLVELSFNDTNVIGDISVLENCSQLRNLSCNNEQIDITTIPLTLSRLRRDHNVGYCMYTLGGTRIGNLAAQFANFDETNSENLTFVELTGLKYKGTVDLSGCINKTSIGFADSSITSVKMPPKVGTTRFTPNVGSWDFSNCVSVDVFAPETRDKNVIAKLISNAVFYNVQIKKICIGYMYFEENYIYTLDLPELGEYNPNGKNIGQILNWLYVCNVEDIHLGAFYSFANLSYGGYRPNYMSSKVEKGNLDTLNFDSFTNLKYFSAHDCEINNLNFLKNCYNLENIWMEKCSVTDISGIKDCTKLAMMHMPENLVTDLTVLSNLTSLRYLSLEYNSLYNTVIKDGQVYSNLSVLSELNKKHSLRYLYLANNTGITNYDILKNGNWSEKSGF